MVSQLSSNAHNQEASGQAVIAAQPPLKLRPDGWFERRCKLSADRVAVKDDTTGKSSTYRELAERVKRAVRLLAQRGVRSGDRVGILSPNDSLMLVALFACRRLGAIMVPFNWRLHPAELQLIMEDCTPTLVLYHAGAEDLAETLQGEGDQPWRWLAIESLEVEEEHPSAIVAEMAEGAREDDSDAPWIMIYTGGTTGKPKGVVLTDRSVYWNAVNTVATWQLTEADVTLTVMPMFHTGGLNALTLPILMCGGTVVCIQSFEAERMVHSLEQERCTVVLLVPTMYHLLVQSPLFKEAAFHSIRAFISGGAPCQMAVYAAFAERGLPFKEGYGATESGPNNFVITPEAALRKQGSVGLPMLFNDVKLVGDSGDIEQANDVGELALRGRHLFDRYWNNEAATEEVLKDGWFLTGDLAKRDEEGYYYIVGRKKDMIITGGENVYPLEIEHRLEQHPDIVAAAVIGVSDQKWGEIVAAAVVLRAGRMLDPEALQAYCREHVAKYKVPKRIMAVVELPKTVVGKLDKKALLPLFAEE